MRFIIKVTPRLSIFTASGCLAMFVLLLSIPALITLGVIGAALWWRMSQYSAVTNIICLAIVSFILLCCFLIPMINALEEHYTPETTNVDHILQEYPSLWDEITRRKDF